MELEDHLFFLFTQVIYRRDRALHEGLKPIGMLPTEFRVLSAVLRRGAMSMQDLAHWTAYERTRLTHMLHGMEAHGWVRRTTSEEDRRTVVVEITSAGTAVFRKAKRVAEKLTVRIMEGSVERETEQMRRSLRAMRRRLIDMGY